MRWSTVHRSILDSGRSPPTPDYKLGTLAAHYGVRQAHAHNALDDARVLAAVLRALIADAAGLGIAPPLLACPPKENYQSRQALPQSRSGPKMPCAFAYPGRLETGGRLVQRMKIAITGDTSTDRIELVSRAEAAGLDVTGAVSRRMRTSFSTTSPKPPVPAWPRTARTSNPLRCPSTAFRTTAAALSSRRCSTAME
ncbi:hypothetical protein OIE68_06135 [Nocardia vinacea]|uniref:Exonuclease domain-containing protein n=1 Tax=Nocardia vinacea TaxID=96468 RepID=A0ABZ1YSE2_9NOCA|nr:hypothetical protein OIE68_06135 [Nocardia vinacea]